MTLFVLLAFVESYVLFSHSDIWAQGKSVPEHLRVLVQATGWLTREGCKIMAKG